MNQKQISETLQQNWKFKHISKGKNKNKNKNQQTKNKTELKTKDM